MVCSFCDNPSVMNFSDSFGEKNEVKVCNEHLLIEIPNGEVWKDKNGVDWWLWKKYQNQAGLYVCSKSSKKFIKMYPPNPDVIPGYPPLESYPKSEYIPRKSRYK